MVSVVNKNELVLYFMIWICANCYAIYKLYEAQTDILSSNNATSIQDLEKGSSILSRNKDVSDIEWNTWEYLLKKSWVYLVIQFMVSESLRATKPCIIPYWFIFISVLFILINFGIIHLILVVIQPLIFLTVTYIGRKKYYIWITGILLLSIYNSFKYEQFLWEVLDHEFLKDEDVYLLFVSIGWIDLRCICYCIDYIDKSCQGKDKKEELHSIYLHYLNLYAYVLYLPFLYTGPIVMYNEFEASFKYQKNLISRLIRFAINMIIFKIYTELLNMAFHYIYFLAMREHLRLLEQLSVIALCGGGLWMGLQFHLKYVISYGTSGCFALLDNIKSPPLPRCIVRIHVYSHMWRFFDVGLYKFLIGYIYKPILDVLNKYTILNTLKRPLASLLTFAFIFFWHGTTRAIFIWSILNFIGVTCENFGTIIMKTERYSRFKNNVLITDAMEQRFVAAVCAPLLALSAISNFYLFAGYEVGNLFFKYLTSSFSSGLFILISSLYACCHVSMALIHIPARNL